MCYPNSMHVNVLHERFEHGGQAAAKWRSPESEPATARNLPLLLNYPTPGRREGYLYPPELQPMQHVPRRLQEMVTRPNTVQQWRHDRPGMEGAQHSVLVRNALPTIVLRL